jgi:hypothetical protein
MTLLCAIPIPSFILLSPNEYEGEHEHEYECDEYLLLRLVSYLSIRNLQRFQICLSV